MNDVSDFSICTVPNARRRSGSDNGPLSFLRGDRETGWLVARNPRKPLNHLDSLRRKEAIAVELDLHNTLTPAERFDHNYKLLEHHQGGDISTESFLKQLSRQLNRQGREISIGEIRRYLREYATVCHMEFHPSDACNLSCLGCTYGHDGPSTKPLPINYPFRHLPKIARLKPRSMVVIGGGEPILYRDGPHRFQELINRIRVLLPGIKLGLVTNGTHKTPGDWPNEFSWIRLSLDAASEETYEDFRGKPLFHRVLNNYLSYLDHAVPFVGISFLFARANIHEYTAVADLVFHLVKDRKPNHLHKVNIQYRPLRRDPHDYHRPFNEAITEQQIQATVQDIRSLASRSSEIERFLREQTNIAAVLRGNTHSPYGFSRCFYSQTFKIVRASGDLRPCCVRVVEPEFSLGSIIDDPLERIALNTLYVGARRKPHCSPRGCRQCHVNYVFEQGLAGRIQPSRSPEVLADPMY